MEESIIAEQQPSWKNQPCKCIHCGRDFPSMMSKNSHLMHCKKRILSRYFKVKSYIFILQWNPLKRRTVALNKLIQDFHDTKLCVGALNYLVNDGTLIKFDVVELSVSKELIEYPDGILRYRTIKDKLKAPEIKLFEDSVIRLKTEKPLL